MTNVSLFFSFQPSVALLIHENIPICVLQPLPSFVLAGQCYNEHMYVSLQCYQKELCGIYDGTRICIASHVSNIRCYINNTMQMHFTCRFHEICQLFMMMYTQHKKKRNFSGFFLSSIVFWVEMRIDVPYSLYQPTSCLSSGKK